jgi:hypothetical protein
MSELIMSRIELDSEDKVINFNGFLIINTNLRKITLQDNSLTDLDVIRGLHRNKTLQEVVIEN